MTVNAPVGNASADNAHVGVVELGSGSAKLFITDGQSHVDRLVSTDMSANLKDGGLITRESIEKVNLALAKFKTLLAEHNVEQPVVVATAAARAATNKHQLEAVVDQHFGVQLKVIDEQREGELAYLGATAERDLNGSALVIDIGSGSTEYVIAAQSGLANSQPANSQPGGASHLNGASQDVRVCSLPIGSWTITNQYLHSDPLLPEELSSALSIVELHLDDLSRELPQLGQILGEQGSFEVVGVGAIVEIAIVELGLDVVDNVDNVGNIISSEASQHGDGVDGYRLSSAAVEEVFRALATESLLDRAHNPGLKPELVRHIVGSMCILVETMRQFSLESVTVSERGLRHGLAGELLAAR